MAFLKVATLDDVWSGELFGTALGGVEILVVNVEGSLRAYLDECPHKGTPLSTGLLRSGILSCPTHQWEFDVRSGCGINPRTVCLRALPLMVQDGEILVDVEGIRENCPVPMRRS